MIAKDVERDGIFSGENPFLLMQRWMVEARSTEPNDPDAVALSTVDASGLPNVRVVLLREIAPDGFYFYTNYDSVKGQELDQAGQAAFVMHWKTLRRQVRVRGLVERAAQQKSDDYYNARPLGSRIGAWASQQSKPLNNREELMAAVSDAEKTHGESPKRPPNWGGYKILPLEIEFWADGAHRLHDRFRWSRAKIDQDWVIERLNP